MARIGFYGGCFNPPTKAHIELAIKAIRECNLDKVVFVPIGDLYEKAKLEKGTHRYNMLRIACKDKKELEVSDIEIKSNRLYKAIDIFEVLKEQNKEDEIYFLMGADNLERLPSWKNSDKLINEFNYIVFDRDLCKAKIIIEDNDFFKNHKEKFRIVNNNEFHNCSSTRIREELKNGEKPEDLDNEIYLYIRENNIYL